MAMFALPGSSSNSQRIIRQERKPLFFLNVPFLLAVFALVAYGLIVVHSAVEGSVDYSFRRQVTGVVLGFCVMLLFWSFDYRKLAGYVPLLLGLTILLLLSPHLPFVGVSVKGATSWVKIFGVQFQPGEPAKIVAILLMAAVVSKYRGYIRTGREYLKVLGICAVPFICFLSQPDLGSGLVTIAIAACILFVGGSNHKWLLLTVAAGIACIALVLWMDPILDAHFGEDVFMKDYQMNRLLVFIDPELDPTGAGYNLDQAKIAIGSGGLLGKGLGNGTQSTLGFLPEAPTDFIFCVIGEELGFVGTSMLLLLYLALFVTAFHISLKANDLFGSLIVIGVIGMWAFQVLENIGMCSGLMPITGIPLPFISYGSSFMITNFMALGLIMSVWTRRPSAIKRQ
ncbi:MAG: rod shape-determining protein RodA [Coriobacteriales bacterium]|nr:rod shape-determining protein RodA [Coriobacteriales bacterium]